MRSRNATRIWSAALAVCLLFATGCEDSDDEESQAAEPTTEAGADAMTPESDTGDPPGPDTSSVDPPDESTMTCDAEPILRTTEGGVEFVRTPDACFDDIVDWPFEARYVEIDGLRQGYVDEGPADGPVVLLLHGQPTWSYLYRKMIPPLAEAGYRVIAMDHLGMGRSDKPTDIDEIHYVVHSERLIQFIDELGLEDINLFVQDWGSLIGLRVAGLYPEKFARIAVGDGTLPVIPADIQPQPVVEDPNEVVEIPSIYGQMPDQQSSFFDGCELSFGPDDAGGDGGDSNSSFGNWMEFAMKSSLFRPSEVIEALTWFPLSPEVEAAYDAPYPSRIYLAGPRKFPSMINEVPGETEDAWQGLTQFTKPFLTVWASNDPGNLGQCATQQGLIDAIPGADGQPHDRLPEASHFLQDDQGPEIAARLVDFFGVDGPQGFGGGARYCEIILAAEEEGEWTADVWGTQGLNDCPAEDWDALDPNEIASDTEAAVVTMNGPRYWFPYVTGAPASFELMDFGNIQMRKLATIDTDESSAAESYAEKVINRTTTYTFPFGQEIYELTSPAGDVYVMQSLSQIVDSTLAPDDLNSLGDKLELPEGWTYVARRLDAMLVMVADGQAIVIQDELTNTYQKVTGEPASGRPDPVLPVADDGTGTPCSSDADCADLDASKCLVAGDQGFCTVEGCTECGEGYQCCGDCDPATVGQLPFTDSACVPAPLASALSGQAGCTCQ